MKRPCETELWMEGWFQALPPEAKLLWFYIRARCDYAGVWLVNWPAATKIIGMPVGFYTVAYFFQRLRVLPPLPGQLDSRILIREFIQDIYGPLSRRCPPHRFVFRDLEKNDISPKPYEESDKLQAKRVAIKQRRMARKNVTSKGSSTTLATVVQPPR